MNVLQTLAAMPDRLEAALAEFPAGLLAWEPPDWAASPAETFSALATACHLRDIERDGYHLRLRRTATEELPDLASIDSYALARERGYAGASLAAALADFRAARGQTVRLVSAWDAATLRRRATFAEYGTVTALGLLHLLVSHDLQHLSGLRWLLARASALP